MTDKTLNQLATDAIKALAAFNAANADATKKWNASIQSCGYAAHFKQCPQISDALQYALLDEVVFFDPDPAGSLAEMRLQNSTDDEPTHGRVRLSDAEWDFSTSRGVSA